MTLDIIQDNYINNHKYSYVWKWFLILALIIYLLKIFNFLELSKSHQSIFTLVCLLIALISIINMFLFTRIGKLEVIKNIVISRIDDTVQTIQLDTIKKVKISSTNKNQYLLKFDSDFEVMVEIKNEQLNNLKRIFINHQIEVIDTSLFNKLKKWLNKTNN